MSLWRDKSAKKESQLLNVLFFVTNSFWKLICGHSADSLERSTENENEYMIFDNDPLISRYISPPKELISLNCSIFYGGMIESILRSNSYVKILKTIKIIVVLEFDYKRTFSTVS